MSVCSIVAYKFQFVVTKAFIWGDHIVDVDHVSCATLDTSELGGICGPVKLLYKSKDGIHLYFWKERGVPLS